LLTGRVVEDGTDPGWRSGCAPGAHQLDTQPTEGRGLIEADIGAESARTRDQRPDLVEQLTVVLGEPVFSGRERPGSVDSGPVQVDGDVVAELVQGL
jgi:hypothetical protein